MNVRIFERVALARDLPEHGLRAGDLAVVVEELPPTKESEGEPGYALEVFNALGETIDVVLVPASAVKPVTREDLPAVRTR